MLQNISLSFCMVKPYSVSRSQNKYTKADNGSDKSGNMMRSHRHLLYLEVDEEKYYGTNCSTAHIFVCPAG